MRKKFRVAVEGQTTDKRAITRQQIQQMAATYDKVKYGARIWMEHFRSLYPDSAFRAYGDVVSVNAEEIQDGALKGKMALFAEIDATPDLMALAKAKQKVYFSIEMDPDFAGSGTTYLVGLGVTDSPASLGTEYITFSASAQVNPLTGRKTRPENAFSTAEAEWVFTDEPASEESGLLSKVKGILFGHGKKQQVQHEDVAKAVEEVATFQASQAAKVTGHEGKINALEQQITQLTADLKGDRQKFEAFKASVDKTPNNQQPRPDATGGNSGQLTDC